MQGHYSNEIPLLHRWNQDPHSGLGGGSLSGHNAAEGEKGRGAVTTAGCAKVDAGLSHAKRGTQEPREEDERIPCASAKYSSHLVSIYYWPESK